MNTFNPYQQWLGIPDAASTPNHYRLLGLRLFEDTPSAISTAVTRAGGVLCAQLSGPYAHEARRLLQEIETARTCLLSPRAKAEYDAALRLQLTATPPKPVADYTAAESIDPLLPPTASSWRRAAGSVPTPPAPSAVPQHVQHHWTESQGLPPLPPGALPAAMAGQAVLMPRATAAGVYATIPMPATSPAGSYSPSGYFAPAVAPPPTAYVPSVPMAQAPPAAPMAYAPAAIPVAAAVPQAAMAIPVAAAAPMAMPVYAMPSGVPAAAIPIAQAATPQATMPQAGVPQAMMAPSAESDAAIVTSRSRFHWRRQQTPTPALFLASATAVLVVVAVIVVALNRPEAAPGGPAPLTAEQIAKANHTSDQPAFPNAAERQHTRPNDLSPSRSQPSDHAEQLASSTVASKGAMDNLPPATTPIVTTPVPTTTPTPPAAPPKPAPTPTPPTMPDPKKEEAVTKALNLARTFLSKGDVRSARTQVDAARKADVPNRVDEIDRVEALAKYSEDFDKAVRGGIKNLEIGGQFAVKDSFVGVVEVQAESIVLRVQGQNKAYPIAELPAAIAYALAESWLRKEDAATKIILGTYQAMQPRGDRAKARELWQAAASEGARIAAEQLLPELNVPLPTDAGGMPAVVEGSKPGADGRFPLPGATAQSQARAEVRQMFEADFAEAKDAATKAPLAAKLIKRAQEPSDAPAMRYIMLQEAGKLAAEAGDFDSMNAALDQLGEHYKVDVLTLKADTMFDASKSGDGEEFNKALATAGLTLCDEAVLSDKVDAALKIARTAHTAAKKSGDPNLVKQCAAREKEVRDLKK